MSFFACFDDLTCQIPEIWCKDVLGYHWRWCPSGEYDSPCRAGPGVLWGSILDSPPIGLLLLEVQPFRPQPLPLLNVVAGCLLAFAPNVSIWCVSSLFKGNITSHGERFFGHMKCLNTQMSSYIDQKIPTRTREKSLLFATVDDFQAGELRSLIQNHRDQ